MKKILMLCLAIAMGAGVCVAQKAAAQKKETTTVFAADVDCDHCVKKIMDNVPALGKGVKDVQVDLAKKEVTVVYDASKNSDENIVKGFASLKVTAEPKACPGKDCCAKTECADKACADKKACCGKEGAKKECAGKACAGKACGAKSTVAAN